MDNPDWQPTVSASRLKDYARLLENIRNFFQQREVVEVSVPCISSTTSPAPHLESIRVEAPISGATRDDSTSQFYLQTSPEFFMKRLLCSGSGPIYRMGPSFRRGELSSRHNPEFTMLEWYRPAWHYHQLIDEVEALIVSLFGPTEQAEIERTSYQELFEEFTGVDPHQADFNTLAKLAHDKLGYQTPETDRTGSTEQDRSELLELVFSGYVLPKTENRYLLVYDFPVCQAELAQTGADQNGCKIAERFELYINGIELANGYQELTDAAELERRLESWTAQRQAFGKEAIAPDQRLIEAQQYGLPVCSGVALGVDRLAMCLFEADTISDVIAFPIDRA